MARKAEDVTGRKFHQLTAIKRIAVCGRTRWVCKCSCGSTTTQDLSKLKSGSVKSCGCLRKKRASETAHGHARRHRHSGAYKTWCSMKQRCCNSGNRDYENYGGRGITVCKRWLKFENFLADMGDRPSKRHTIERLDNDKGYRPSNCRWAPREEQNNNRRNRRLVTAFTP